MSFAYKRVAFLLCLGFVVYLGIHYYPLCITDKTTPHIKYASRIVESSAINDILKFASDNKTLVVFDLDNTLIYANQEVGSDQWFFHLLNEKIASGLSREEALSVVLPMLFDVYNHMKFYPVEKEGPAVLSLLQNKGIPTVALTTRSLPLVERTRTHLKEAGFNFASCNIFAKDISIQLVKPALLTNGIIFCNDNNKGQTLLKVLELCNFKPETIVFIDDKLSHLFDVEKECLLNKIQFIGIRYGKLDSDATRFDSKQAELQYKNLLGKDYSGQLVHA
jgi:hypothetical protein